MSFYRLLTGKHHEGWDRKAEELRYDVLADELQKAGVKFKESASRTDLIQLFKDRIGDRLDTRKVYRPGDIVESNQDLCDLNDPPDSIKFQLVNEQGHPIRQDPIRRDPVRAVPPPPPVQQDDGLNDMSIDELIKFAEGEEVDLQGKTRKQDIIAHLRGALI